MNLAVLEAFRAIMEKGTVSAAAETLGRSQSAVSRMLDKLEDHVGLPLFERRKGQITPTETAHLMAEEIEGVFLSFAELDRFGDRVRGGEIGGVRIAVLPALGLQFMPEVISRFSVKKPKARVLLSVRMSKSVIQWLSTRQADIGFAEMPLHHPNIELQVFSSSPYVIALPKRHPLTDLDEITPQSLATYPMIGWTPFANARVLFDNVMRDAGVQPIISVETTLSSAMCAMVKRGMGVGLVDPFSAWSERDEDIIFRPFKPNIPFNIMMLRSSSLGRMPLVESFLGEIEQLRDEAQVVFE